MRMCIQCGKDISNRHKNTKYCHDCFPEHHRKIKIQWRIRKFGLVNCIVCGKPLPIYDLNDKPHKCQECERKTRPIGKGHPSWKGGRCKRNGYVYVACDPSNPLAIKPKGRAKTYYIREHVLNWEKANNIPLPDGYVVHHLNGIKTDNRPENLMALPMENHSPGMLNKALQKRIKELELIISQQKLF
jgi:hypothetical protein